MTDASSEIMVIGGGTMGAGIAVAALANTAARVTLVETAVARHDGLRSAIRADASGRGADGVDDRLRLTASVEEAPAADLVVEAVPESLSLKLRVLRSAEDRVREDGIVTSNTSSLSIAALAEGLRRPERFLGMHFFQPVPDTVLTELILHPGVAGAAVEVAEQWTEALHRESISAKDAPGFATSRLGLAIGLEAMRMVEEGVATPTDIDRGMRLGYQHAVGPLRMTDMVGLDVRLAIAEYLASTLGSRFEPPRILRDMVEDGRLGRKSGQGFFTWDE